MYLTSRYVSKVRSDQAAGRVPTRPALLRRSADTLLFVHSTPCQAVEPVLLQTALLVQEENCAMLACLRARNRSLTSC